MLHKTSFPISGLQYLFVISEVLFHPLVWSLNHFLAPFILSTYENQWHFNIIVKRVVYVPSVLVFVAVFAIPALLGGLLRCLLHLVRRPYVLSIDKSFIPPSITERRSSLSMGKINVNNKRNSLTFVTKEKTYTICSANICLPAELFARINNLPDPATRSFEIGQRIVIDQFFFQNSMNGILSGPTKQRKSSVSSKTDKGKQKIELGHSILTHFPKLDFLCLQETWDRDNSYKLISELHKVFPWILYDVGKTRLSINRFMFNSGLMFCSKYEILDANFLPFNDKVSQGLYLSKGLLMIKVLLSSTELHDNVGYIFTSHLQAYQGSATALQKQLDEIVKWTKEFREETNKSTDNIMFDMLCGDFNFDNISPVDETCTRHELFDVYEDVCRVRAGKDHDWTVGTEARQMCLWEEQVSTPEGLKQALLDPILRHRYIIDANIKEGTMNELCNTKPLCEESVRANILDVAGRRRIDYVLYRKDNPVNVQNYSFITRLATQTDHIPISMTFTCQSQQSKDIP